MIACVFYSARVHREKESFYGVNFEIIFWPNKPTFLFLSCVLSFRVSGVKKSSFEYIGFQLKLDEN